MIIAILLVLGYGASRLKPDQEIYSVLPKGKGFESLTKIIDSKEINNKVFFSINRNAQNENEDLVAIIEEAVAGIEKSGGKYIKNVTGQKEDVESDIYEYYINNFPLLIDSSYYQIIEGKIQADSIKKSLATTYRNLNSPSSGFLQQHLLKDPIGISSSFFKELENVYSKNQVNVEDGIMFSKDNKSIFIYGSLNNCTAVDKEILYKSLVAQKASWNKNHPNNKIDFFGSFQIHVENALQVKKDTVLTVSLTIFFILLILIVYYRKLIIPVYFILPALFSGLFALGITGYIHPEISGLSMATAAVLLGILLNYSFHFFTHLRHTNSLEQTIKELSTPMLVGSLTTILAFAALLFANSKMLNDFGLLASLSLLGAALFSITILPAILHVVKFNFANLKQNKLKLSLPAIPTKYHFPILIVAGIVTAFMMYSAGKVEFDSDLSHLSYHTESVKLKEDKFVGINPNYESKIFIFATGSSIEQAAQNNQRVYEKLKILRSSNKVSNFISTGDFLIPESLKKERKERWEQFWSKHATQTVSQLNQEAVSYDFASGTFNDFQEWLSHVDNNTNGADTALLAKLELTTFLNKEKNGDYSIITSLVLPKANLELVKGQLKNLEGVVIFDRVDLATSLIDSVKKDFNFLLYISAAIVFITLLIVYGRIELTILAFLPMAISWIWILGTVGLLGIKFNFVNIIISTFIFGLGDDFSIFINDGLLSRYKTRSNALDSFKSAIFLSAITTLLGMGVLGLASHPAIQSIALISVLGVLCIVVVSLVIQPILFNFFAQSRVDKGKSPVTLFELIMTSICFALFFVGCTIPTLFLVFLLVLPFPKRTKRAVVNFMLSFFARLQIYTGFHVTKRIFNKENMDFSKPSIIIANHSSFLDILLIIMLSPKVVLVVKDWVYRSPFFGRLIRFAGYLYTGNSPEDNLEEAKKLIAAGYSIAIFPEGARSENGEMARFHKGAFLLAKELNVDITPMMIHGASDVLSKGDYLIKNGRLSVKFLPRIKNSDSSWGESYTDRTKLISKYFKAEYKAFKYECEDPSYLYHNIFQNYVFKGPVLEWYFRIKWRFEGKNFAYYDKLLADRKTILDIGCGYGYLSFFLHFKDRNRKILGIDYDEEKIAIAANSFNKTDHLHFEQADIIQFEIPACDVIFFNDVLHYLSALRQTELLARSADALNANGILIIRDGITDLSERHNNTIKTEEYSTGIVGFNKKTQDFSFFSTSFIKELAEKNGLTYEMLEQSKKTSNVLFILRKP